MIALPAVRCIQCGKQLPETPYTATHGDASICEPCYRGGVNEAKARGEVGSGLYYAPEHGRMLR